MIVASNFQGDMAQGIIPALRLEDYGDTPNPGYENFKPQHTGPIKITDFSEDLLCYGINSTFFPVDQTEFKRKVLLNLWSPCEFTVGPDQLGRLPKDQVNRFNEVYTICPYSAKWYQEQTGIPHKLIWHPYATNVTPGSQPKDHDVVYFGGCHGPIHEQMLDVISQFNYGFMSLNDHPKRTACRDGTQAKYDYISQFKISVCFHVAPLNNTHLQTILGLYMGDIPWEIKEGYENLMPQFKARMHEAAYNRCVNLVYRDPWGLARLWYRDDEFVYFDDMDDLKDKIQHILDNYNDYQDMIEKAYQRSLKYGAKETYDYIDQGKGIEVNG